MEAATGDGRRIDVAAGCAVIECKPDLRPRRVVDAAVEQLAGYVKARTAELDQRFVGILTDGVEWRLYHLQPEGELGEVSQFTNKGRPSDPQALVTWLEGILATARDITPTPDEIQRRLGAGSAALELDRASLAALYGKIRSNPSVQLKRNLWARLLAGALGTQFKDTDDLFIDHTLLVRSAEAIAHAAVGFDLTTISPKDLMSGKRFADAQIRGVVSADFFDWVIEDVDGDGERFVRSLARRLARFRWDAVEHDVMKVLYESVISPEVRKQLGEYYTPDWLAQAIVERAVQNPQTQRILDPACGSGTFIFHAVRRVLQAHHDRSIADQVSAVTQQVYGIDLHPVAVALARVTFLLAIGIGRLRSEERPALNVPIYLGDSLRWLQEENLLTAGMLEVETVEGSFADRLRFPNEVVEDTIGFDSLVDDMATRATFRERGSAVPSLVGILERHKVPEEHHDTLEETFATMCRLHDDDRNHIWAYYVRNLARPLSLAREGVDVLVGNPPWLAYRHMPKKMQERFRQLSEERGLWEGGNLATHQDLAGLFCVRTIELYFKPARQFAYVMPHGVLSRPQYKGLSGAQWGDYLTVAYGTAWDLARVEPPLFPMPASVLFGSTGKHEALPQEIEQWAGKIPEGEARWPGVTNHLTQQTALRPWLNSQWSPYADQFREGASLVPRFLVNVEDAPSQPLGMGAGRRYVRSRRTSRERAPYSGLPSLEGSIESRFIYPIYLGESVVPYRTLEPLEAVIPYERESGELLSGASPHIDAYPGLADWWRSAEETQLKHRSSERLTLTERVNYHGEFTAQFPIAEHRVVYPMSGKNLLAARVSGKDAVIDYKLYWSAVDTISETRYLCAILNSTVLTRAINPLQSQGQWGPRDFCKVMWSLPIERFNPIDPRHAELTRLAAEAEEIANFVQVDPAKDVRVARKRIREAIAAESAGRRIDEIVGDMLNSP